MYISQGGPLNDGGGYSHPNVRHDQMTTFLGPLRCAACVQGSHQCFIREADKKCVLCTAKDGPCIFTRSVIKEGTRAIYSWEELVGSETTPQQRPLSVSASPSRSARGRDSYTPPLAVPGANPSSLSSPPRVAKSTAGMSFKDGYRQSPLDIADQHNSPDDPSYKKTEELRQYRTNATSTSDPSLLNEPRDPLSEVGDTIVRPFAEPPWDSTIDRRSLTSPAQRRLGETSYCETPRGIALGNISDERNPSVGINLCEDTHERSHPEAESEPKPRQLRSAGRPGRKRKLSRDSLEKIAMVRSIGACIRCKVLKEACDLETPCGRCEESRKRQRVDQISCIRTHLQDLMPLMFAGATTGEVSATRGNTALQRELMPLGQQFLQNAQQRSSGRLLGLAFECFEPHKAVIYLEKVREVLRMLDTLFFHQRTTLSPHDLTEAVYTVCVMMVITRLFVDSCTRHQGTVPGMFSSNLADREAAIQSVNGALEALFMVAATAMSENDCFDLISSCAADALDSREAEASREIVPQKDPTATQSLYKRVSRFFFRHDLESLIPNVATGHSTIVTSDECEKGTSRKKSTQTTHQKLSEPSLDGVRAQITDAYNQEPSAPSDGQSKVMDMAHKKPFSPEKAGAQLGKDDTQTGPFDPSKGKLPILDTGIESSNSEKLREDFLRSLTCSYCDHVSKTQSEANKHKLRHEKPFKCLVPGCTRAEGFSTQNDLDRHKKSLHAVPVPGTIKYRCAAEHCLKRGKVWPRADNFRQHCQRLHPSLDTSELMEKSLLSEPATTLDTKSIEEHMTNLENTRTGHSSQTISPAASRATSKPPIPTTPNMHLDSETSKASEQSLVTTATAARPLSPPNDENNNNNQQRTRESSLGSKTDTNYRVQSPPTAQDREQTITSGSKHRSIETSSSVVAKIPWDATPVPPRPTYASSGLLPVTITHSVYGNCVDPGMHIVKTSREGNPKLNGPKGPRERFIVIPGTCPVCK